MSDNSNTTPPQNGGVGKAVEKGVQTAKKAKQTAQNIKKIANAIKNISSSGPLMYVLFWVFVVIVALIILTGIIMFIVTMPGMVMDKLKALFKEIGNYVAAFFGADTTQQIDDVRVYETLDYIEDMGWDLKGEGFLTGYYETGMEETIKKKLDDAEEEAGYDIDDQQGVVRNGEGNIILADSDFIFTYIMSDNYVYTLKNKNLATQDPADNWFEKLVAGAKTAWYKIKNLTLGPIFDAIGLTDYMMDKWGKGLIGLYYEEGDKLGVPGTAVNTESFWNWDTVDINTDTKKLSIARNTLFNVNNNEMEYSLDGWTGRYGMPLEFLLSVHKATMMPDLAFDMVTSFPTEIYLLLHKASGEAIAGYKTVSGNYIKWSAIQEAIAGFEGRNWLTSWFTDVAAWFKDGGAKVEAAKQCGVDVGTGEGSCSCTFKEGVGVNDETRDDHEHQLEEHINIPGIDDNTWHFVADYSYTDQNNETVEVHKKGERYDGKRKTIKIVDKACTHCKEIVDGIWKYMGDNTDYAYITYIPYISKVTDHWYRDVYFVLNTGMEFVDYDYDYESVMKERWTLYETYTDNPDDGYKYNPNRVGEFIAFEIDEDGEYKMDGSNYVIYDGTFDEAKGNTLYLKNGEEYVMYTGVVNENGKGIDEEEKEYTLYMKIGKDKEGKDQFREYKKGDTIAVAKKAITVDASDTDVLKDLGWEKSGSVWTAYEKTSTTSGFERLFPDEEITSEREPNETYRYVMSKCYINLNLNSNIVQVGEGQRTETNTTIKKMFLNNKYFRYDGSTETADIITEIREKLFEERKKDSNADNNYKYGLINDDELDIYITRKEKDAEGKEVEEKHYVKDYVGTVLLNQDSLNAFTMLENTHTLDADFIYRDFKELVVELGYFEKEELTDEKARLLQFPVPETGSYGYPDRTIDKREAVEGTMIHSQHDINANKKYTLKAMVQNASNEGAAKETEETANVVRNNSRFNQPITLASSRVNNNRLELTNKEFNTTEVGAVGGTKKPEQVPLRKFIEEMEKMSKYMDEVGYDYCVLLRPTECPTCSEECKAAWGVNDNWGCIKGTGACPCTDVHCHHAEYKRDAHSLTGSFIASQSNPPNNYGTCCNYQTSWAFQSVGILEEGKTLSISSMYEWMLDDLNGTEIEVGQPYKPGDVLIYGNSSGADFAHVDVIIAKNGSSYEIFNGGHYIHAGSSRGDSKSSINTLSREPSHVVRLNWGDTEDGPYKGFLGNEAVVSPVSGILMEYGTYPIDKEVDEDGDGELDKEERINIDLKYGPSVNIKPKDEKTEGETPVAETPATPEDDIYNVEKREWADEVGYATIFVLNTEVFEMLDESITHRWRTTTDPDNKGEGLVSKNGQFFDIVTTEDQLEDLTEDDEDLLDETVYGFKEFTEMYEKYGIAGYFVTIDGFKCEVPDTTFVDSDDDKDLNDESGKPNQGKSNVKLTYDTFKNIGTNVTGEHELIQTLYEPAAEFKMASKKATEKLNVEETIKLDAFPILTISNPKSYEPLNSLDELVFIKEGTVLGRTFTDRELVDERQAKGDDPKYNFEYYAPEEEVVDEKGKKKNMDRVVGNYIMVKMLDPNKPIENIEDYMKLDEMTSGDQEYQFREGDLELLADAICHEGCGHYCAGYLDTDSPDDMLYLSISTGFTIINKLNTDSGFKPDYNDPSKLWDSGKSPLYNLVCRIPDRDVDIASAYGYTTGVGKGWYGIAFGLRKRVDANDLEYCDTCLEAAEYIKDNDSMNFTNNGRFGAEYSAGDGMPHTMWEQGGGYYGNHKIWLYIDKNKNNKKDTDESDYYLFDTDE